MNDELCDYKAVKAYEAALGNSCEDSQMSQPENCLGLDGDELTRLREENARLQEELSEAKQRLENFEAPRPIESLLI